MFNARHFSAFSIVISFLQRESYFVKISMFVKCPFRQCLFFRIAQPFSDPETIDSLF